MPKTRVPITKGRSRSNRVKFKTNGRKNVKSALDLSNAELIEMVKNKEAGKARPMAQQVLSRRGVPMSEVLAA